MNLAFWYHINPNVPNPYLSTNLKTSTKIYSPVTSSQNFVSKVQVLIEVLLSGVSLFIRIMLKYIYIIIYVPTYLCDFKYHDGAEIQCHHTKLEPQSSHKSSNLPTS